MNARVRSIVIIAAVVLFDRITKIYIRTHFNEVDIVPVIRGIFNIVHTENPGAAFGFLAGFDPRWRMALLLAIPVIVMAIIAPLLFRARTIELVRTGLALIFGGALGNFWDRVTRGTVTDFIQVFIGSYEFPSFNVADSAITVGAALLLIDLWMTERKKTESR